MAIRPPDFILEPLKVVLKILWERNISKDQRKENVPLKEVKKEEPSTTSYLTYFISFYTFGQIIIPALHKHLQGNRENEHQPTWICKQQITSS